MKVHFQIRGDTITFFVPSSSRVTKRIRIGKNSDQLMVFNAPEIVRFTSNSSHCSEGSYTVGFFIGLIEDGSDLLLTYIDLETSEEIKNKLNNLGKKLASNRNISYNSFQIKIVEEQSGKLAKFNKSGKPRPYQTVINIEDSFLNQEKNQLCLVK